MPNGQRSYARRANAGACAITRSVSSRVIASMRSHVVPGGSVTASAIRASVRLRHHAGPPGRHGHDRHLRSNAQRADSTGVPRGTLAQLPAPPSLTPPHGFTYAPPIPGGSWRVRAGGPTGTGTHADSIPLPRRRAQAVAFAGVVVMVVSLRLAGFAPSWGGREQMWGCRAVTLGGRSRPYHRESRITMSCFQDTLSCEC
jgi:hypothetical protein